MDGSHLDEELRRAQQYTDIPKPIFAAAVLALTLVCGFALAMFHLERSLG